MGSAVSESRSSDISDEASSSKPYGRMKGSVRYEEQIDAGVRLHSHTCDRLYRWAMWRMYMNEEMSKVITLQEEFSDRSASISGVASAYTAHPDGYKYGRLMKMLFPASDTVGDAVPRGTLPDNMYLVYGIPRVSLHRGPSKEIQELHASVVDQRSAEGTNKASNVEECNEADGLSSIKDADKQISELFFFVSSDITQGESHLSNSCSANAQVGIENIERARENETTDVDDRRLEENNKNDSADTFTTIRMGIPAVNKSRQFWEKLASKRTEIIDIGKQSESTKQGSNNAISDDILVKQRALLKKTLPKQRTSKDLWRSLAERKTEILQLREIASESTAPKKHESKSGHLWNFLFSKKKELDLMKNNKKSATEQTQPSQSAVKPAGKLAESDNVPVNFEDSFQRELATKLKKRREAGDGTVTA